MMHQKQIRWGILGTSYISEVMAHAIHESDKGSLSAIASRSKLTAKAFSDKFSIHKYYDNYQSLLDDDEIDVVYIGLPNHLHKEWMIRAAKAGKHILCEKPFVMNTQEACEVIACVENAKIFCMEALMYRYHPFTEKLLELINNKVIGDIKLYHAYYAADIADIANPIAGGAIRNLGCYPLSLVRLLAGSEPTEIVAMGRMNLKSQNDSQASVLLKFSDQAMAVVSTADDLEMVWQFDIYGTKGNIKIITNPWLPGLQNKLLISLNQEKVTQEVVVDADKELYVYQIDTVNGNILSNHFSKGITLSDSLGNTKVIESWLQQVGVLAISQKA